MKIKFEIRYGEMNADVKELERDWNHIPRVGDLLYLDDGEEYEITWVSWDMDIEEVTIGAKQN